MNDDKMVRPLVNSTLAALKIMILAFLCWIAEPTYMDLDLPDWVGTCFVVYFVAGVWTEGRKE